MDSLQGRKKDKIICPIIAIWVVFILKLSLLFNLYIFGYDYNYNLKYYKIYPISTIIDCIASLVASIFVTKSFELNKYGFYKTGLFIILGFAIPMTVIFSATEINFIKILIVSVEWSQFIVLIIYNNKIKKYFSDADLNNNLFHGLPREVPLQL